VIARYDIGLALEHSEPASRDLTITNKILQYLNAGLAVIATPTAGQREVFAHSPAIGLLLDLTAPVAATAARLDALIRDPELPARRAAARQLAETRYCWEREAPRLLALVAGALERPNS
jgi:glycosyltransferase involved in cell wall biosynthesis